MNAFNQQLTLATPSLKNFSFQLTRNREDANDLFQETALKIIANESKFALDSNFKGWALTIMRNTFINNYRKAKRRYLANDKVEKVVMDRSNGYSTRNQGDGNLMYNDIQVMVNKLNSDVKEPFLMAYDGFKYDEIAETLDLPVGTIKSRIFVARKQLKEMFEKISYLS
jgi:RNA polymerase sigma-70 factor, ECF subfamily